MREPSRMRDVQVPIVPIIGQLIRSSPGTISLGQGMVGYGPPPEALRALAGFGQRVPDHQYGPVEGLPELVEALERKLESENGIRVRPESRVVVTAGGNMAFMNAVLAITDPGDEVMLQAPHYFNHEMAIVMAGCRPVAVHTDAAYQLQPDDIRQGMTRRTRAVVTVSPNNPSGAVYPEEVLREVNAICAGAGVYHIHDEAYEYFTYGSAGHFSPGASPGAAAHTISLYSLSKAYGFASWRIGYMVAPSALFESLNKIQDTILICPAAASQQAAIGALQAGRRYCREKLPALAAVRDSVLRTLGEIAHLCAVPAAEGAFYCLLRIHADVDPLKLVQRLVTDHRVAVLPGSAFGLTSDCHLRISYGALDGDTVAEGVGRLVEGLRAILERPARS
jgi:aspartate/methionine/tyrosine aminotransferase